MLRAAHHLLIHYYLPYFYKKNIRKLKKFSDIFHYEQHIMYQQKCLIKDLHLIGPEHHKTNIGFSNALPNEQRIKQVRKSTPFIPISTVLQ